MTVSVKAFRNKFSQRVLNFVWSQWSQMGVAGSGPQNSRWVIDPEPLLAFTSEVARRDARMFDEVLDWLVTNGRWINTQRLSTIMRQDETGAPAVMGAIASWMSDHDKSTKWRGIARYSVRTEQRQEERLFLIESEHRDILGDQREVHFERYGLIRGPIHTRGMTRTVNMKEPLNVMFKSRALFGIGIRADVMTYLLTTNGGYARHIAEVLGYNHMRVSEVLADMAEAGIVAMHTAGRTKQYRVDRERWRSVILPDRTNMPQWVNWRPLLRAFAGLWRAVWALDETRADAYIFSSKMRNTMQTVRDDFHGGGIPFTIEDDASYLAERYLNVFVTNVDDILKKLGV